MAFHDALRKRQQEMEIILNNTPTLLPDSVTNVKELVEWRSSTDGSVAVAMNNRLVIRPKWASTELHEGDKVTLITAAYGG